MNIFFLDLILGQKILQVAAVSDQYQVVKFSADRIVEACYLLSGADAGADYGNFSLLIVRRYS